MALTFASPSPPHTFSPAAEVAALDAHFTNRHVPASKPGRLLLVSWNIANLGAQGRTPAALEVIAHVLSRFDLCAIQEVKDNFKNFLAILGHMGKGFDYIMTDTAGNEERLAFIYRKKKVEPRNLFAELALRPREYPKRDVTVRWKQGGQVKTQTFKKLVFQPFDRNPFIGSFAAGKIDFTLVNVHLYFGKEEASKKESERLKFARRVLEIFALAAWSDRYIQEGTPYDRDVILLGDMNVPKMEEDDPAYKALTQFKWQPLDYLGDPAGTATSATAATPESAFLSKTGGSNLGGTQSYDQMVFAPEGVSAGFPKRILQFGVFDFDNAVFKPLWQKLSQQLPPSKATPKFNLYVKHHFSDHRPLWVELNTT